jgi:tRNA nucleotidyltransferase (CCA-adding enzyme)
MSLDLAAHFGGGGHSRAAAALIKDRGLEEVCKELLRYPTGFYSPSSNGISDHVLQPTGAYPDTSAEEAANLMRRYGYEGYPVVEVER